MNAAELFTCNPVRRYHTYVGASSRCRCGAESRQAISDSGLEQRTLERLIAQWRARADDCERMFLRPQASLLRQLANELEAVKDMKGPRAEMSEGTIDPRLEAIRIRHEDGGGDTAYLLALIQTLQRERDELLKSFQRKIDAHAVTANALKAARLELAELRAHQGCSCLWRQFGDRMFRVICDSCMEKLKSDDSGLV